MLGILYENGGPITFCVKGSIAIAKDGIGPLLEVEAAETMVAWSGDGGVGGGKPPVTTTMIGILGFLEEERGFYSISIHFKVSERSFNKGWLGVIYSDPVASKDPCWSIFRLSDGKGGSSVTGGRPRSLCDWRRS
jgi:hypothetical protein